MGHQAGLHLDVPRQRDPLQRVLRLLHIIPLGGEDCPALLQHPAAREN